MRMESSIEAAFKKKILKWAAGRGIRLECLKFVVPGVKGYPDRILIWGPAGRTMFIEFKQPGAAPEPLQDYVHGLMRAMGCEVQVHDNPDIALEAATRYIESTFRTIAWDEADSGQSGGKTVLTSWKGQDCNGVEELRGPEKVRYGGRLVGARSFKGDND